MTKDNLTKEIIKIIGARLNNIEHYKIFLFGSRANGKASERSDYDIAIDAKEEIPLHLMAEINADIASLRTLKKVDVVDLISVSKDFKEVALQKTKVLYEK